MRIGGLVQSVGAVVVVDDVDVEQVQKRLRLFLLELGHLLTVLEFMTED